MSVELIAVLVVVVVVLGFAAYKLGWFTKAQAAVASAETALKSDVTNAVADLKAHVTATVAPPAALTGDHVAQIVTAQGNALAAAVAAVAKPAPAPAAPAPFVPSVNAFLGGDSTLQAAAQARNAAPVEGPAPTDRPPYPTWGRVTLTAEKTSGTYEAFTPPAGDYDLRVTPILGYEFTLNGVKVNPGPVKLEGSQTLSVSGPAGDVDANFVKRAVVVSSGTPLPLHPGAILPQG